MEELKGCELTMHALSFDQYKYNNGAHSDLAKSEYSTVGLFSKVSLQCGSAQSSHMLSYNPAIPPSLSCFLWL
jgi:hypothetical protein